MDSIIEQQRRAHEEIERVEKAIVDELATKPRTHKGRLIKDHIINDYLVRIQNNAKELLQIYQDADGHRKEEIADIGGDLDNVMTEYYRRLKKVKDFHRNNPDQVAQVMETEFVRDEQSRRVGYEEELSTKFSGEEGFGRYLDLNQHYDRFLNLKGVLDEGKISYMTYVQDFDSFDMVPRDTRRKSPDYITYLQDLNDYLETWFHRAKPLVNIEQVGQRANQDFVQRWDRGLIEGWDVETSLFCVACNKDFAKQTVYDAHLSGKKHIKAAAQLNLSGNDTKTENNPTEKFRNIAELEFRIQAYGNLLKGQKDETRMRMEHKQALTDMERAESEEEFEEPDEEEEDDKPDGVIYNPLKLPIGWDGKPIPYWLYKLHGLSVEYPCEICGNFVYQGRKAFDMHFQEWRHANGMRSLGIPNSKHFHDVTKIEDALVLWDKLKAKTRTEAPQPEVIEEIEDADGNVYNKKTYEDLIRQGLL